MRYLSCTLCLLTCAVVAGLLSPAPELSPIARSSVSPALRALVWQYTDSALEYGKEETWRTATSPG